MYLAAYITPHPVSLTSHLVSQRFGAAPPPPCGASAWVRRRPSGCSSRGTLDERRFLERHEQRMKNEVSLGILQNWMIIYSWFVQFITYNEIRRNVYCAVFASWIDAPRSSGMCFGLRSATVCRLALTRLRLPDVLFTIYCGPADFFLPWKSPTEVSYTVIYYPSKTCIPEHPKPRMFCTFLHRWERGTGSGNSSTWICQPVYLQEGSDLFGAETCP